MILAVPVFVRSLTFTPFRLYVLLAVADVIFVCLLVLVVNHPLRRAMYTLDKQCPFAVIWKPLMKYKLYTHFENVMMSFCENLVNFILDKYF